MNFVFFCLRMAMEQWRRQSLQQIINILSLALCLGLVGTCLPLMVQAMWPTFSVNQVSHLWQVQLRESDTKALFELPDAHDTSSSIFTLLHTRLPADTQSYLVIPDLAAVRWSGEQLAARHRVDYYSSNSFTLWPDDALAQGRLPRAGQQEVLVSADYWQQLRVALPDLQLPGELYIEQQLFRIVGVLSAHAQPLSSPSFNQALQQPLQILVPVAPDQPLPEGLQQSFLYTLLLQTPHPQPVLRSLLQQHLQQIAPEQHTLQPRLSSFVHYQSGNQGTIGLVLGAGALLLMSLVLIAQLILWSSRLTEQWQVIALKYALGGKASTAVLPELTEFILQLLLSLLLAMPFHAVFSTWFAQYGLTQPVVTHWWLLLAAVGCFLATLLLLLVYVLPRVVFRRGQLMSALQSSGKGSVSGGAAVPLKILTGIQLTVATLVFYCSTLLISGLVEQFFQANAQQYDKLYAVEVEIPEQLNAGEQHLLVEQLRQQLQPLSEQPVGVLNASPLDFIGEMTGYRGPADGGSVFATDGAGQGVIRAAGAEQLVHRQISYLLSVVKLDQAAFQLLNLQLLEGQASLQQRGSTVLTPEAGLAIVQRDRQLTGELLPAGTNNPDWFHGIEVAGVVQVPRLSALDVVSQFFATVPVVFVPLPTDQALVHSQRKLTVLLQSEMAADSVLNALERSVMPFAARVQQLRFYHVSAEQQQRLYAHSVNAIGALAMSLLAVLVAVSGSYALIHYQVGQQRIEHSIRLMVGATPIQLALTVFKHYMLLSVVVVSLVMALLYLLSGVVHEFTGASYTSAGQLLFCYLSLLTLVMLSIAPPLRRLHKLAPMAALRGE